MLHLPHPSWRVGGCGRGRGRGQQVGVAFKQYLLLPEPKDSNIRITHAQHFNAPTHFVSDGGIGIPARRAQSPLIPSPPNKPC